MGQASHSYLHAWPSRGSGTNSSNVNDNTFRLSLSSNAASQPTEEVFSSALLSKTLAALLVTNSVRNIVLLVFFFLN
jgi:hypothetical protein